MHFDLAQQKQEEARIKKIDIEIGHLRDIERFTAGVTPQEEGTFINYFKK